MPISAEERDFARTLLTASLARLKSVTANLTPDQWAYTKEGRWSPIGIVSHLRVVETGILRRLPNSPPPERLRLDRDSRVLELIRDRKAKLVAPERTVPDGRITDPNEVMRKLDVDRANTLAWLQDRTVDHRAHAMEHPFLKTLDGYQWLLMIGAHMERHTAQIEEVKAAPEFPAP